MAIRVRCSCGTTLNYPESYEGQFVPCRACRSPLAVAGEKIRPPRISKVRLILPAALVLLLPALVLAVFLRSREPRFISAAEEYREGSKAIVTPDLDGPRIERVFAALAAASKDGNERAFADCFHERRMLAEIELRGALQTVGMRRDEVDLDGELDATLRDWCDQLKNSFSAWQSVHRCTPRFLEGRGEAEALVVMKSEHHLTHIRFWLIKEKDAWGIYDYEFLKTGFRLSTHNGILLVRQAKGEVNGHQMERASGLLDKARNLMVRNKLEEALEALAQAEPLSGRNDLLPTVDLVHSEVLLRLNRPEEALLKIDEALTYQKDLPQAVQFRGVVLHALGRFEDCLRSQEDYLRRVGEDALAYLWIGMSYEALGQRSLAMEAYRKGAACDEFDMENLLHLKRMETPGK